MAQSRLSAQGRDKVLKNPKRAVPISDNRPVGAASNDPLGAATEPLWSRIERHARVVTESAGVNSLYTFTDHVEVELTAKEREALDLLGHDRELRPERRTSALEATLRILSAAGDAGPNGELARSSAVALKLIPEFVAQAIPEIRQWMEENQIELSRAQLFYSGHTTHAMVSLAVVLSALGLARLRVCAGRHSGDLTAAEAIETVLGGKVLRRGSILEHRARTQRECGERLVGVADKAQVLEQETARAKAEGRIQLANKAGPIIAAAHRDGAPVAPEDLSGQRRYLQHNANDSRALGSCAGSRYITSVEDSLFKLLEARFVGEAKALAASRVVREAWGIPVHQSKIYILGYGPIGKGLTRAIRRLGFDRDSLVVIEPDPSRRHQASAVCTARETLPEGADPYALIFNTADGTAIDGTNAARCAKRTMVFNLASSGQGVDVQSILTGADRPMDYGRASYHPFSRVDPESGAHLPTTRDIELKIGGPEEEPREVRLVNVTEESRGRPQMEPLNLAESPWPDRFACTTAMAIVSGVLGAMQQSGPGVTSTPRDLERRLIRVLLRTDMQAPRPLDLPKTRYYDGSKRDDPLRDFAAFRRPAIQ